MDCNRNQNTNDDIVRNANCMACGNRSMSRNTNCGMCGNRSMSVNANCGTCGNRSMSGNANCGTCGNKSMSVNANCGMCGNKNMSVGKGCNKGMEPVDDMMPGMGFVPWQKWKNVCCWEEGLSKGTIFEELYKPYVGRPIK